MSLWLPTRKRKLGQRCWLQDHDGTYYRTYALIQAELDQAMARGRGRLADDLIAEGLRVLEEGPLRKDELGQGDVLSLVGAFLSLSVAATIASGLVDTGVVTLPVVFAGLCGGIIWNLLTWFFGIPSSSSHALIGGVIGSTLAAAGGKAVEWQSLFAKVIIPAGLSPVIA